MFRYLLIPALAVIAVVIASSCKAKKYLPMDFPKAQILFGNGGGITGMTTTFLLQENGQVFKQLSDTSYKELAVMDKKVAKTYFERLDSLDLKDTVFMHPGNMYFFLEGKTDHTSQYKFTWGDGKHEPPAQLKQVYLDLIQYVRDIPKGTPTEPESGGDQIR